MSQQTGNRGAFLDMLAVSEGTSTNPETGCAGYDIIVTGIDGKTETFWDFSDHPFANGRPPKTINHAGLTSTASGRYQQMLHDWAYYRALLNLPDFGPMSQDLLALQHIRECGALPDVDAGRFAQAVFKCKNIWASLPGAGYGQHENDLAALQSVFRQSGGMVTA